MTRITSHVLDVSRGRPAAGVPVTLERLDEHGAWAPIGRGRTSANGRIEDLGAASMREAGTYRLTFDTGAYFGATAVESFYPYVQVVFDVRDPDEHHHVPLLLSPFGYSTYRGS